ncbi:MAG TPA: YihY/virulence factor BrkB family protein [Natronosporangium sp.]
MSIVGFIRRVVAGWVRLRRRNRWVGHVARAARRYNQADGRRLAAAVTFYGFFAVFALAVLGFAVLGYVLDNPAADRAVERYLAENLPVLDTAALRDARGAAGVIGFVSLPVIGLLWVDSLRSSIRAVWRIEEYPGGFFIRWFIDGLALIGLAVLLAVSLTVAFGTGGLLERLVVAAGGAEFTPVQWLLAAIGFALGYGVNTLLAIFVLTALPRLRMPWRRVLGPGLLIAAGVAVLKALAWLFVERVETNPALHVVAGAAALLIFLLVLNQLILFAAALTATGTAEPVIDLASPRRRPM